MNTMEEHHEHEGYLIEANKVVVQVRDQADQPETFRDRLIDALENFLRPDDNEQSNEENNPEPKDRSWRYTLKLPTIDDLRVIEFSAPTQTPDLEKFSLVPLMFEEQDGDSLEPDRVLQLLSDAYNDLGADFIRPKDEEGEETNGSKFRAIPLDDINGVVLLSISPNWLGGTLSHGKPTGGPGSFPVSRPVPTGARHKFKLKGTGTLDSLSTFRRPGAQVVILDTARSLDKFLAPNMFTEDPAMEVFLYPDQNELDLLAPYWTPDDHYDMCDHGTFIASIIREITPSTKIYLYQVLNCYGDGTFLSVSHGLTEALDHHCNGDAQVVFNCSLGLVHNLPEEANSHPILLDELIEELMFKSMQDAFDRATSYPNVTVVASAGNNAKEGEPRPYAWYPAAAHGIVSVAALPRGNPRHQDPTDTANYRKFKLATYSNSAHSSDPTKDRAYSFATFGGDVEPDQGSEHSSPPNGGVRGVYIGSIPRMRPDGTFSQNGPANATRVVEWSGTSFAAPIISALIAAPDSALEYNNPHIPRPYEAIDGSHVILVRQGG